MQIHRCQTPCTAVGARSTIQLSASGNVPTRCVVNVPANPSVADEEVEHCNEDSDEHHGKANSAQTDKTITSHTDPNRRMGAFPQFYSMSMYAVDKGLWVTRPAFSLNKKLQVVIWFESTCASQLQVSIISIISNIYTTTQLHQEPPVYIMQTVVSESLVLFAHCTLHIAITHAIKVLELLSSLPLEFT